MKTPRRHQSLIPLSREHHYGLMLCLRIRRGLPDRRNDEAWVQAKARQVTQFFESELTLHFKAEEEILFPAMQVFSFASELISGLLSEHRMLEQIVKQLSQLEHASLAGKLEEFADLLEAHIREEERQLFPLYEQQASKELARAVGRGIEDIIGQALEPKNPDLLE